MRHIRFPLQVTHPAHLPKSDRPLNRTPVVLLINTSENSQRLWEEWNSWGYYNLSLEFTDDKGKTWVAKKAPRAWTRNWHTWFSLAPGEIHVFTVDLSRDWVNLPPTDNSPLAIKLRAIYSIFKDNETEEDDIWTGKVISAPISIEIWNSK